MNGAFTSLGKDDSFQHISTQAMTFSFPIPGSPYRLALENPEKSKDKIRYYEGDHGGLKDSNDGFADWDS